MISRDEILKGQPCPPEYEFNLEALLIALNKFRQVWGQSMLVTSGYRTPEHNDLVGGAKNSAHLFCQAADIWDRDRSLAKYCARYESILEKCGLWWEHPLWTDTWVHLQIRPESSRCFIP